MYARVIFAIAPGQGGGLGVRLARGMEDLSTAQRGLEAPVLSSLDCLVSFVWEGSWEGALRPTCGS